MSERGPLPLAAVALLALVAGCAGAEPSKPVEAPPAAEPSAPEAVATGVAPGGAGAANPQDPSVQPAGTDPAATDHQEEALRRIGDLLAGAHQPSRAQDREQAPLQDPGQPSRAQDLAVGVEACCLLGREPCRACLDAVAKARLPPDELWPSLGRFLGPLRGLADLGIDGLAASTLDGSDGAARDRLFRMAVASSRTRRGEADDEGQRATTLPLAPQAGQPTWILVELPSPCPDCRGAMQGPADDGRMHLALHFDCPDADLDAEWDTIPAASRAVWAHHLDALPEGGISLYVNGGKEPLLRAQPGRDSVAATSPPAR